MYQNSFHFLLPFPLQIEMNVSKFLDHYVFFFNMEPMFFEVILIL